MKRAPKYDFPSANAGMKMESSLNINTQLDKLVAPGSQTVFQKFKTHLHRGKRAGEVARVEIDEEAAAKTAVIRHTYHTLAALLIEQITVQAMDKMAAFTAVKKAQFDSASLKMLDVHIAGQLMENETVNQGRQRLLEQIRDGIIDREEATLKMAEILEAAAIVTQYRKDAFVAGQNEMFEVAYGESQ